MSNLHVKIRNITTLKTVQYFHFALSVASLTVLSQPGFVNTLRCYSCIAVATVDHCAQMCFYDKRNKEARCTNEIQCHALQHISISGVGCCKNADLCNGQIFSSESITTRTTVPPSMSTSAVISKIVINAPDRAAFKTSVQLQCVSVPPADKYFWKFNGTSLLPAGVTAVQYASMTGDVSGVDVLTILQLTKSSFGMYTCIGFINGQTLESSHFINIMPETIPSALVG